jgi:TDG/mug DNA glycosylase family protein
MSMAAQDQKHSVTKLRPSKAALLAAAQHKVPDLIRADLQVVFCGINPGLYSAWAGHHFARPGNRFWPSLSAAGFTDCLLRPDQERELLGLGYGITNLVDRATASASELRREELQAGGRALEKKVERYRPRVLAVLGVGAYRLAFDRPTAGLGLQSEKLGRTLVWVLPNPSGLNAHFTPKDLARIFREFRERLADGRPT